MYDDFGLANDPLRLAMFPLQAPPSTALLILRFVSAALTIATLAAAVYASLSPTL